VEVGVNIELPYCPNEFIDNLVTHKYQQFNVEHNDKMTLANVKYQQFQIKIYNKGRQYYIDKDILRFEVKVIKMVLLKKYGIHTLWDLMDPIKLDLLQELLLETFNNLTYWDDSIIMESLSEVDRKLLENGRNPKFWKEHLGLTGSNASKNFRKYQELINRYGNKHFYEIRELINKKWDSLNCFSEEAKLALIKFQKELEGQEVRVLTEFHEEPINKSVRVLTENQEQQKTLDLRVLTKKADSLAEDYSKNGINLSDPLNTSINNLNIGEKIVSLKNGRKVCIVTGLDISMQKDSSRFLSITGIKYIYQNNPSLFKLLKSKMIRNWLNAPLDKQISEIAHTIRNKYHSKRIHTKKAIKRLCSTPALFSNYDLISCSKKRIAEQL
jgi:hypothetical protein